MGLRHAGSPVSAPDRLTRARQDALLLHGVVHARIIGRQLRCASGHRVCTCTTMVQDLAEVREALRLDDSVLDDLIARGGHRHPWESAPDRERVTA